MKKVNILGTEYTVETRDSKSDQILIDKDGYTDFSLKLIVIEDISKENGYQWGDLEAFRQKVLRHELVHAFMYESGLDCNSEWGRDETLIDWIAIQLPKISEVFKELNI